MFLERSRAPRLGRWVFLRRMARESAPRRMEGRRGYNGCMEPPSVPPPPLVLSRRPSPEDGAPRRRRTRGSSLPVPLQEASAWAAGRSRPLRAILWLYCAWTFVSHLRDPLHGGLLKGLNLGIHELGHLLLAPAGELLGIAGGSIAQCLAPLVGFWMFRRQRDWFAMAFAFAWLSTSLFDLAAYVADARALELPLVSPFGGEDVVHDWNWLLDRWGLLGRDQAIARTIRFAASSSMLVFLVAGGWLLREMGRPLEDGSAGEPGWPSH